MTANEGGGERRGWMLVGGKQPARKFHCTEFSHSASAPLMSTVRSLAFGLCAKSPIVFYSGMRPPLESGTQGERWYIYSDGIDILSFVVPFLLLEKTLGPASRCAHLFTAIN